MANASPSDTVLRQVLPVEQWKRVVLPLLLLGVVAHGRAIASTLRSAPITPSSDSAFFGYVGWLWTHTGRVPYLHVWDIKPPAIFEVAAVLSVLPSPYSRHLAAAVVTSGAALASVVLAATLALILTRRTVPSIGVGVAVMLIPGWTLAASYGLRPKYFVIAFGLGALVAILRDRLVLASVLAALSAAFWQGGAIFVVLTAVAWWRAGRVRGVGYHVLTTAAVAFVVVLPVAVTGGVPAIRAMIVETVLIPLVVGEGGVPFYLRPVSRATKLASLTYPMSPLFGAGILTTLSAWWWTDRRDWAWVAAATAMFLVYLTWFDFDGGVDTFPVAVLGSIGLALCIVRVGREPVVVAALAVLAVALVLPVGGFQPPIQDLGGAVDDASRGVTDVDSSEIVQSSPWGSDAIVTAFSTERVPSGRCHIKLSRMEVRWMNQQGIAEDGPCGVWR